MDTYNIEVRSGRTEPSRGKSTTFEVPFKTLRHWKRDVISAVMRGREATKRTSEGHCSPLNLPQSSPAVPPAHDPSSLDCVYQKDVDRLVAPPHSLHMFSG